MIYGGADSRIAQCDQLDDGNNLLTISPGVVVTYERNNATNRRQPVGRATRLVPGPAARERRARRRPVGVLLYVANSHRMASQCVRCSDDLVIRSSRAVIAVRPGECVSFRSMVDGNRGPLDLLLRTVVWLRARGSARAGVWRGAETGKLR